MLNITFLLPIPDLFDFAGVEAKLPKLLIAAISPRGKTEDFVLVHIKGTGPI
ncbi:hypothetical protein [Mucilaginibacter jinjuensis]|uniref:Uncharacterized protein n=1 Tax=Mucilaginibacter jinjuensis TaxID=1176721 RepID=A0ABY7TD06_9SPHI|nr:hypothetical protein [Mucilaginibacter jinjuensis]WCT14341.1 hypothetical protein PQO05_10395 [Mucilaginibacter jinjuensis]